MEKLGNMIRLTMFALCASAVFAAPVAAADCYSVGQRVAAQNGGTLAKASEANRGGQAVCVIVVLVPGKGGERPRRTEIVVPKG
ncbi:hypothetical protein ACFPLB_05185 [Aquamicrobium segne]|uniref:Uncharacterized protein n=1 Tax=Aquamicrobium segne TaxID=469547 RepID=A0ABW0GVU4_9HYPH